MGTKRRDKKQQKQQQQHWNKSLANAVGTYEHISKCVFALAATRATFQHPN